MVFVVRVRSPSGMQRLVFESSATATLADLRVQITDVLNVPVNQQRLSKAPIGSSAASVPSLGNDSDTLAKLGIQNGDVLYLANQSQAQPQPAPVLASGVIPATQPHIPPHTLTKDCQHGPRGACPFCLGVKPGQSLASVAVKCQHGAGVTCINCSSHVKSGAKETATWLCAHPDTVFCPKCIPPTSDTDGDGSLSTKQCQCDHSKGQECIRCVVKPAAIKIDKIPFSRFLADKKSLCKFKHNVNVTCAFCAPPPFPTFAGKTNCDKGHAPYPRGVCLSCAPPNANLRVQSYRHCDSISVEGSLLAPFYTQWTRTDTSKERCAILLGRYVPEPVETNNPGAIRAQVHAIYEPPQEGYNGGVKLLRDEREKNIHLIASRLSLECIGWVVCVPPRPDSSTYGGKVLMSGDEIVQAARFQSRYCDENGYSRFVTLVLEYSKSNVEPVAFQVSDVAVGLTNESLFDTTPLSLQSKRDPYLLQTKKPSKSELQPTVIYKDRPMSPGEPFIPDELLVKVIVSAPKAKISLFRHSEFPSNGGELYLKTYLQQFANEDYEVKMSDFNLLVNLVPIAGEVLVMALCDAIRDGKKLTPQVRSEIDSVLLTKNLL